MTATRASRVSWLYYAGQRMRHQSVAHRLGELIPNEWVTLQRGRTQMRSQMGFLRACLHVKCWNLLTNWLPISALHTSDTTDRRCLASPAPVLPFLMNGKHLFSFKNNQGHNFGYSVKLGLGMVCDKRKRGGGTAHRSSRKA